MRRGGARTPFLPLSFRATRASIAVTAEDQGRGLRTRTLDAEMRSRGPTVASTECPAGGHMISPTMREGEVRSLAEIAAASIAKPAAVTRDVHSAVSERVFGALGPLGIPVRQIHDGISKASYRGIRAALAGPVATCGRALAPAAASASRPLADSTVGSLALGALNGFAGDRLARDHPDLALELSIRRHGREIETNSGGLAAAFPDATGSLAIFVHGLCETDEAWRLATGGAKPRPGYGARLRDELGYTPVYVRYNSGLHVSDNGRRLAAVLEQVCDSWPVEVEELALIGHSMGGLVGRSACHYGEREGHLWTDRIRHVVCLGTPHLGAPLERAANVAGWALKRVPETRPFGDMFLNGRSAGIKDLRFGSCVEEDWCDGDPDEFLRDRCREVPFLESASYYFVGATLTPRPDGVGGLVGDLLVHYPSAAGNGRRRRIPFETDNGRHLGGAHHLQLLNHPAVYDQIRTWLARPPS
jgi:pimeloyl-ACP methyl ester carboxylesterase